MTDPIPPPRRTTLEITKVLKPKPLTNWRKAFRALSDVIEDLTNEFPSTFCNRCPALSTCREDHNSDENRCRRVLGKWAGQNYKEKP